MLRHACGGMSEHDGHVLQGYIDKSYLEVAVKGYKGILDKFIEVDKNGVVSITKACAVAGLGGKANRRPMIGTYRLSYALRQHLFRYE